MGLALEEPDEHDEKIFVGRARVYLQQRVSEWFDGAELDWETSTWGGGFTFNHPDLSSCG